MGADVVLVKPPGLRTSQLSIDRGQKLRITIDLRAA